MKAKAPTKTTKVASTKKPNGVAAPDVGKRPRGRPSLYTPEIATKICERIAKGDSLRAISRIEGMPDEATIRGWALDDKEGFFTQYTRAIQIRASVWAEEIVEISDDATNDWMETNGKDDVGYRINGEHVQRSRLRVDSRKWMLSKVLPKIYGDKLDLNHGVQPENPLGKLFEQISGTPLRPGAAK